MFKDFQHIFTPKKSPQDSSSIIHKQPHFFDKTLSSHEIHELYQKMEDKSDQKSPSSKEEGEERDLTIINTRSQAYVFVFDVSTATKGSGVQWGLSNTYSSARSIVSLDKTLPSSSSLATIGVSWKSFTSEVPFDEAVLLSLFTADLTQLLVTTDFSGGASEESDWKDLWTILYGYQKDLNPFLPLAEGENHDIVLSAFMTTSPSTSVFASLLMVFTNLLLLFIHLSQFI